MEITHSPLVSIITPVYNGAQYLDELIQSVLLQDYPYVEHVIIDDGSKDDGATVAILNKYSHLHWTSRANKGQYSTMNDGLQLANGEYVCFVSADDILTTGAVRTAIDFLLRHPSFDGVFGITTYMDHSGNDFPFLVPFRGARLGFHQYFAHIAHCSLYVKAETMRKKDLFFDPSLRYTGDYDWVVRMHLKKCKVGFVKRELSKVRLHESQTSRKYKNDSFSEFDVVRKKLRVNALAYALLSGINIWMIRVWKIARLLKEKGLLDAVKFLFNFLLKKV
ncbi:MAG: glycosyltransferase [Anaerolineales bacterium]|jgi:glycosyltransferase involved in cell wall biosynthesis|nr:glycosyltransferase [Anaerolineales bacterium]